MTAGVYAVVNNITQARYIGSTKNFTVRSRAFRTALRTGYVPMNGNLAAARREHDESAFSIELLEEVEADDDALERAERRWIAHFAERPGGVYNIDKSGRRPRRMAQLCSCQRCKRRRTSGREDR